MLPTNVMSFMKKVSKHFKHGPLTRLSGTEQGNGNLSRSGWNEGFLLTL